MNFRSGLGRKDLEELSAWGYVLIQIKDSSALGLGKGGILTDCGKALVSTLTVFNNSTGLTQTGMNFKTYLNMLTQFNGYEVVWHAPL